MDRIEKIYGKVEELEKFKSILENKEILTILIRYFTRESTHYISEKFSEELYSKDNFVRIKVKMTCFNYEGRIIESLCSDDFAPFLFKLIKKEVRKQFVGINIEGDTTGDYYIRKTEVLKERHIELRASCLHIEREKPIIFTSQLATNSYFIDYEKFQSPEWPESPSINSFLNQINTERAAELDKLDIIYFYIPEFISGVDLSEILFSDYKKHKLRSYNIGNDEAPHKDPCRNLVIKKVTETLSKINTDYIYFNYYAYMKRSFFKKIMESIMNGKTEKRLWKGTSSYKYNICFGDFQYTISKEELIKTIKNLPDDFEEKEIYLLFFEGENN